MLKKINGYLKKLSKKLEDDPNKIYLENNYGEIRETYKGINKPYMDVSTGKVYKSKDYL